MHKFALTDEISTKVAGGATFLCSPGTYKQTRPKLLHSRFAAGMMQRKHWSSQQQELNAFTWTRAESRSVLRWRSLISVNSCETHLRNTSTSSISFFCSTKLSTVTVNQFTISSHSIYTFIQIPARIDIYVIGITFFHHFTSSHLSLFPNSLQCWSTVNYNPRHPLPH